jgi:integrase
MFACLGPLRHGREEKPIRKPEPGGSSTDGDLKCAAVLALNTTMRGCELKGLRRKDVDLFERTLTIRRDSTKTDGGARVIQLLTRADQLGIIEPDHFVFPACECGVIDPTKAMKGWRTAWRHLTTKAGLKGLRLHDLRHQAIKELCGAGLSDMTIMGIAGHVSKEMLAHYSHIRLQAKRRAVEALEMPLPTPARATAEAESIRVN